MLKSLLGSAVREQVLIFILARGAGYATEIAGFFGLGLSQVQRQLDVLENGGVLVSQPVGRTRVYQYNRRYAFVPELQALLEKAMSYYPTNTQHELSMNRRRPRRRKKPL